MLANLLELYAHDFSEFHPVALGENGRFGYRKLPLYWQSPTRKPFLVRVDGRLAGLVLISKGSRVSSDPAVWDMAEFFIVRGCRRRGVGTRIAHDVWRQFPGPWEVRVMKANREACGFWGYAAKLYVGAALQASGFERNGQSWQLFSFDSPAPKVEPKQ